MSANLPAPMTPDVCDLRKFPGMMVDIHRLLASTFNATASRNPLAWMIGHKLWYRSWHQVPAGSLPNDEGELCYLAELGFDVKSFRRVKDLAMRGWVLCSDGRLYHPTVAETARAAWRKILEQKWRTETARVKKHNQRHPNDQVAIPDMDSWIASGCMPVALDLAPNATSVPEDSLGCPRGQPASVPEDKGGLSLGKRAPIDKEGIGNKEREDSVASAPRSTTAKDPFGGDEFFAAVWSASTKEMRLRAKSKAKVWPHWTIATKTTPGSEIVVALARYLQGDPDVKRTGGPGLHLWLKDKTYEQWLSGDTGSTLDDATWSVAVDIWRQGRGWAASYGPEPGQPGCRVPAHLLVTHAVKGAA